MRTNQPVNNHDDLLSVVDHLLEEELGLKRSDTGGKVTFAGLDPLRPTVLKTGAASAAAAAVGCEPENFGQFDWAVIFPRQQ